MDSLELLMGGFEQALTLENLFYAIVGVFLGTAVGVLPGIGPAGDDFTPLRSAPQQVEPPIATTK
jgi:TctA family transporter